MLAEFLNFAFQSLVQHYFRQRKLNECERILDSLFAKHSDQLTTGEARALIHLLGHPDDGILVKTLSVISNAASFNKNIDLLFDLGCVPPIGALLRNNSIPVQVSVLRAIANLANTDRSSTFLRHLIMPIIDLFKYSSQYLHTQSILLALGNLALQESNHPEFWPHLECIMDVFADGILPTKLYSIKLLVNLSCSSETVVHIMNTKAPSSFIKLFNPTTDAALLLRLSYFLLNCVSFVKQPITQDASQDDVNSRSELLARLKTSNPLSMYNTIFDDKDSLQLREGLYRLKHATNICSDIRENCTKVLDLL